VIGAVLKLCIDKLLSAELPNNAGTVSGKIKFSWLYLHPSAIALSNMNSFKSKNNSTQSPTVSSLAKNTQRGSAS
jgi:hypothetical protein